MAVARDALMQAGTYQPQIVQARRVMPGRVEVLFTVQSESGKQLARRAVICTDTGQPLVVVNNWDI